MPASKGYRIVTQKILNDITPKNRLLMKKLFGGKTLIFPAPVSSEAM